jgi:hypothetical protein
MKVQNRVAARSKTWKDFARSNTGIMGSNPIEAWMFVCVYFVFMLSCVQVAVLRRADPPSKESCWWGKDQEAEKIAKAQQRAVEP